MDSGGFNYKLMCSYKIYGHLYGIVYISHSVVTFVEVDFLWNRTVDSLKTSFHLLL